MDDAKVSSQKENIPNSVNPVTDTESNSFFTSGSIQYIPHANPGFSFAGISRHYSLNKLFLSFLLLMTLPTAVILIQQRTRIESRAAAPAAHFFFAPIKTIMPPDRSISVMLDAKTTPINFVTTVVTFNPHNIALTGPIVPSKWLKYLVQVSPIEDTNRTGILTVSQKLTSGDTAPSGPIELYKIPFKYISGDTNQEIILSFDNEKVTLNNTNDVGVVFTSMPGVIVIKND